jgi:uncharacterized protein (TIGR02246 family)
MKQVFRNLLVMVLLANGFVFLANGLVHAQSKSDETAVLNVPQAFAAAWAKHDGKQLGMVMADDVDFVNVSGEWVHGRTDFTVFHSRLLSGRFKDSIFKPLEVKVRFLRPDQAVLHWNWRIEGDVNQDLTLRKPRFGTFTMIVEKRSGTWLVAVAQNTNWTPPPDPDPEMEGIKPLLAFPKVEVKP